MLTLAGEVSLWVIKYVALSCNAALPSSSSIVILIADQLERSDIVTFCLEHDARGKHLITDVSFKRGSQSRTTVRGSQNYKYVTCV